MMEFLAKAVATALVAVMSLFSSIETTKASAKTPGADQPKVAAPIQRPTLAVAQEERKAATETINARTIVAARAKSPRKNSIKIEVPDIRVEIYNPKTCKTESFWMKGEDEKFVFIAEVAASGGLE